MNVMSIKGCRKIDSDTINKIGIPSIVLMENVAHKIYEYIVHKGEKFIVFCGEGNNGGDGLAIARKLIQNKKQVYIVIIGDIKRHTEDFITNYNILKNLKANIIEIYSEDLFADRIIKTIKDCDIVVDALFGVGLNRSIEGIFYRVIDIINRYSKYIVSVDIPSGVNGDSGEILGIAVKADETYTVEVIKRGFLNYKSIDYLGKVTVINIGIPDDIKNESSENIFIKDKYEYKKMIPVRKLNGHKGTYGKCLILAGSSQFTGAAYITTESAVRSGAGLVTLVVDDDIYPILAGKMKEAMVVKYSDTDRINQLIKDVDVIACGPGLSNNEVNIKMLRKFIIESKCPIVLDADGLNALNTNKDLFSFLEGRAVFTPHLGEMGRLIDKEIKEVESDRIEICRDYARDKKVIMLLKGYNTLISDGETVVVNTTGSSKMASGGMGDCLTGVITSFIAQGIDIFKATLLGCYIHGLSGDKLGMIRYSVNARDVIEEISKTIEDMLLN